MTLHLIVLNTLNYVFSFLFIIQNEHIQDV